MGTMEMGAEMAVPMFTYEALSREELIRECKNKQAVINHLNELLEAPRPEVACSGETPRTEAMIESCGDYEKAYHYNGRFADFARQLERELAEMTKFRDEWKSRTWAAEDKLACTPSPQRESTGMVCPEDGNHCCISICLKQGCREQAERSEPQGDADK